MDYTLIRELDKFKHILFDPEEHTYSFQDKKLTSVTQLLKLYREKFDEERIVKTRAHRTGKSETIVRAEMEYKKNIACYKGTLFHSYAEHYLGNKIYHYNKTEVFDVFQGEDPIEDILNRLHILFEKYYTENDHLIPVRSEYVVGDFEYFIGGMIDQLYYDPTIDQLCIYDWKTNNTISYHNKDFFYDPLDTMNCSSINIYSMQLSLYKYIIEKNTNLQLGPSKLVWFNAHNSKYEIITTFDYEKEVQQILNHYKGDYEN